MKAQEQNRKIASVSHGGWCDYPYMGDSIERLQAAIDAYLESERKAGRRAAQADVARAMGISADKLSKVLGGKRRLSIEEANAAQRFFRERDIGNFTDDPDAPITATPSAEDMDLPSGYIPIKRLKIRPHMGGFAVVDSDNHETETSFLDPFLINRLRIPPRHLRMMEVEGPSMAPALEHADIVLVDTSHRDPSQPAIFVVTEGFGAACKWVERVPHSDPPRIRVISQNKLFDPYEAVLGTEITIVGRVVWFSRHI